MLNESTAVMELETEPIPTGSTLSDTMATAARDWTHVVTECPDNWDLAIEMSNPDWGEGWGKCSC